MKSYDTFLLGIYDALLRDIASWYPEGATEWRRTQARLHSLVNTRGLRYLTIDLVAAGKHFDQCLSSGQYTPNFIAGMATRKGEAVPRLFGGLLRLVFSKRSGKLRIDADVQAISFLRQLFLTAKKVRMTCSDSRTFESVREYFDIEKKVRLPSLPWDDDVLDSECLYRLHLEDGKTSEPSEVGLFTDSKQGSPTGDTSCVTSTPGLLDTIQRVADVMSSDLGSFDADKILPKHGPGAVSDRFGESKYDFPTWPEKLHALFPSDEFAFYNASSIWVDCFDGGPVLSKHEPPSKLIAVPKTQKSPRLIASEPTAHQWIQQGILRFLVDRISHTWLSHNVSFRDQTLSQRLALDASTHRDLATIDLSSASDRVSCWLVERIFRRNPGLLRAFHACRTRWLVNSIDKKSPKFSRLRKFTTMGSALTFPVQTIIYAVICVGVDIWFRNSLVREGVRQPVADLSRFSATKFRHELVCSSQRTRVFGDDIIHPVDSTDLLVKVLTYLGLEVNIHKTFAAGFFRESCGVDAYAGVNVTPVYVNEVPCDAEPESLISTVEVSNNLHKRGLWRTADYLVNELPRWFRKELAVKSVSSGAFGLSSFVGADVSHLKSWWNDQLHHMEVRAITALPKSRRKRGIRGSAALLQYFTEDPPPTVKWENGVGLRASLTLKRVGIPVTYYD
ncbi:MAG: putative replicase protein [Wruxavirus humenecus]|uniref:RNA-directed RNA polymerase n=1 Tax=Leviviridae sp. TaxID=2027243 RepID=A0ABY4D6D1_9VIRU|nr:MAG: putative replicase protein [Leviviridae sp.]